jgi:elongation factor Ts
MAVSSEQVRELRERTGVSIMECKAALDEAGTGHVGAMVVLSSETDFVSKNTEFVSLAREIAMHAAAMKPGDTAELLTQPFIKDPTKTIQDLVSQATQKFGERIEVSNLAVFSLS